MRKIVVVNNQIPYIGHGGGGLTAFSATVAFLEQGFDVSVIALKGSSGEYVRQIAELRKRGVSSIYFVEDLIGRNTDTKSIYGLGIFSFISARHKKETQNIIQSASPDYVFAYNWDALEAVCGLKNVCLIAGVGDPVHLPFIFRKRCLKEGKSIIKKIKENLYQALVVSFQKRKMVRLLNAVNICGAFAAHHAQELSAMGAKKCRYLHTPVVAPQSNPRSAKKDQKFKIVLMGNLGGTVTQIGLRFFVEEIMPALYSFIDEEKFEIHIIGSGEEILPKTVLDKMHKKNIFFRGKIVPADEEFLTADVFLVPNPVDLGIRVRILTAFSFGSLVVSHAANRKGIPELENGENCLLGEAGSEIVEHIQNAFCDTLKYKSIRQQGRETYLAHFTPQKFFEDLELMAFRSRAKKLYEAQKEPVSGHTEQ